VRVRKQIGSVLTLASQGQRGRRGPMEARVHVLTPSRDALGGRAHGPQRIEVAARAPRHDAHTNK